MCCEFSSFCLMDLNDTRRLRSVVGNQKFASVSQPMRNKNRDSVALACVFPGLAPGILLEQRTSGYSEFAVVGCPA